MTEPKARFDRFSSRIKNNPIVASLIILGTIVIALSTFTNAAKSLWGLVITGTRPDVNGEWVAEVIYPWDTITERFTFRGEGEELSGTATDLGLKYWILEGKAKKDEFQFITKTQWSNGGEEFKEVILRYRGTVFRDEIQFFVQRGVDEPIEYTARRVPNSRSR